MKKSLADRIEQYIKVLIERSDNKQIEIQRSELAETFGCVPSQVTYVISTRFTEQEGYITESYRGGKGFVRITQYISNENNNSYKELLLYIDQLLREEAISLGQSKLLKHLITYAFEDMPPRYKARLYEQLRMVLSDFVDNY